MVSSEGKVQWSLEADYFQACSCDYGCLPRHGPPAIPTTRHPAKQINAAVGAATG